MLSCLYLASLQGIIFNAMIGKDKELPERIIGKFKSIICVSLVLLTSVLSNESNDENDGNVY